MKAFVVVPILATLLAGSGCAKQDWIDRTLVTVDVTGTWTGSYGGAGTPSRGLVFELKQQGSTVTGAVRVASGSGQPVGADSVSGTVTGDVLRFKDARGSLEGELTVNGDEMSGRVSSSLGNSSVSLRRIDPSSPPGSPPR
jgi:hypothetical protein